MKKILGALLPIAVVSINSYAAVLEEVVVTAQVRESNLQDVPVSVTALSGDKLDEGGLTRIEDIQAYVPNLVMTQAAITTDVYIRGIGTGDNQGFDQSVGLYVDGVSYGKGQLFRAPFLDVQRVEVLKGPQNILYGKSAVAGALNITTADPSNEFSGRIAATATPEFGEQMYDLAVSGPINDRLAHRLALRKLDSEGYMYNVTLDRKESQRDELTVRYKLAWDVSDNWSSMLKLEYGEFSVLGRNFEVLKALPSQSSNPFMAGRSWLEILDDTSVPIVGWLFPDVFTIDADSSVLGDQPDYRRSANDENSETETYNITLDNTVIDDDGGEFTAISAFMKYSYRQLCDCDGVGADLFKVSFEEDYQQFSQELRWVSPAGERFEYMAGFYLEYSEFDFFDSILADGEVLRSALNALDALAFGGLGDWDPFGGWNFENIVGAGDAGTAVIGLRSPRYYENQTLLASAFLQGTYYVTPALRVIGGLRYAQQRKKGSRKLTLGRGDGADFVPLAYSEEANTVAAVSFGTETHDLRGERVDKHFSPELTLQYDFNDEVMGYASVTRGNKPGGFDARSNGSPDANVANPQSWFNKVVLLGTFEFEEEVVTSAEIGVKSTLFGGAMEVNATAFYTQYDDLQVAIYDGTFGFNSLNAASAVSKGIEIDGRAGLSDTLMVTYSFGLLDFTFDDFPYGTCRQGQEPDNANGVHCDYSGESNKYASDWSGNIGLLYQDNISDNVLLGMNLDMVGSGDYNPSSTLDERVEQEAHLMVNGGIALSSADDSWRLALIGKNLTDEQVTTYALEAPMAYAQTQAPTWVGMISAPRHYSLQLSYSW